MRIRPLNILVQRASCRGANAAIAGGELSQSHVLNRGIMRTSDHQHNCIDQVEYEGERYVAEIPDKNNQSVIYDGSMIYLRYGPVNETYEMTPRIIC